MALLEDILSQIEDMGFGQQSYMGLGKLTGQDISSNLQSYFNLGSQDIPAHMFQGISSDMLKTGLQSTYSPQIQQTGSNLLGKLQETLGGQKAKQAGGGFAGSGQQQRYSQSAKDVYGQGMGDVLAQTGQQRLSGLQNVQDIINQWKETALKIKGTI
tara:strand:+ start:1376 stop:1846 length:471 start_codon:yes stop_codon:yes gene_type:complete